MSCNIALQIVGYICAVPGKDSAVLRGKICFGSISVSCFCHIFYFYFYFVNMRTFIMHIANVEILFLPPMITCLYLCLEHCNLQLATLHFLMRN